MGTRHYIVGAVACAILSVGVACPEAVRGEPGPGARKVCPICKARFSASERFCPGDGVPLADVPPDKIARTCPRCGRSFDGDARFCSIDGAPLAGAAPDRPSEKTAARTPSPANAPAGPQTARPGAAYVRALRTYAAASESAKERLRPGVEALAERFRSERSIRVGVDVRSGDPALRTQAAEAQHELVARLAAAGLPGARLLPAAAVRAAADAPGVVLAVEVSREPSGPVRFSLSIVDVAPSAENAGRATRTETAPGRWVGTTGAARAHDSVAQLAADALRQLNRRTSLHFEAGRKLATDGNAADAVEEYVAFLFGTADFDTPQADEANRYVIGELDFSVLDWVWGEPALAVVDRQAKPGRRRLPLGFRAAGDEMLGGLPATIICLRDGAEMVQVPAASEAIGDDHGPADARPAHSVSLRTFYIDKLETSAAQYHRFAAASAYPVGTADGSDSPVPRNGEPPKAEAGRLPVVHVSWNDAMAYSQWAGKSLPTEVQWERAARGRFGPDYPRSADPAFRHHVRAALGDAPTKLVSVFALPAGLNPYGCQNMLGNAAEWCRDWYDADFYGRSESFEPIGPDLGTRRVVRGGSWQTPIEELGVARRSAAAPGERSPAIGFRCVLNPAVPAGDR